MDFANKKDMIKMCQNIKSTLSSIGSRAYYLWPLNAKVYESWAGYSYEIPKEEQIRSALFAELHKSGHYICELEWDVYSYDRSPYVSGEIDIVGFDNNNKQELPSLLIEVKRLWHITGWTNKLLELQSNIKSDIDRLNLIRDKIIKIDNHNKVFACVFIVSFTDNVTQFTKVDKILKELNSNLSPEKVWKDTKTPSFKYEYKRDHSQKTFTDIFSRADLIIL